MEEKIKIANMYYDFVNEFNTITNCINYESMIENIYTTDTMYFVLRKDKKTSINDIIDKLSSISGTNILIAKLDLTFDGPDDYIRQIEDLEDITKGFVNKEQLSTIVKRKFECDDDFNKFNYLELYYKYKDLYNKLMAHQKQFN